jgi:hypothetical protein
MSPAEAAIIRPIVQRGLDAGYCASVYDGEEWTLERSFDRDRIMAALGNTDEDILRFQDAEQVIVGSIGLVYGNAPDEVINDYTDCCGIKALLGNLPW